MTAVDFKKDRLSHFTLAWFTFPMSTGGLAMVLMNNPMELVELTYVGKLLFYVNCFLVAAVILTQVIRFASGSASLLRTLKHPLESVFVGPALLAFATLINGGSRIAGTDPSEGISMLFRVLFWSYLSIAFLQSLVSYFFLWNEGKQSISTLMPGWVLPIFPTMLVGTVANAVIPTQPPQRAYEMAIAGSTFQGLGFAFCCMMYANLFQRLMTCGLPHVNHRPGLYMCVGPPAFTALAIVGMARESRNFLPEFGIYGLDREQIATVLVVFATTTAIFLWLWAAWFFCFATVSTVIGIIREPKHMTFVLAWWAFIFPNVGFCIATKSIAEVLESEPIRNLSTVIAVFLMIAWPTVLCFMVEGVFSRKIMWHGKDEDRDLDAPQQHGHGHDHGHGQDEKDSRNVPELPVHHRPQERGRHVKTSAPSTPTQSVPGYFDLRCEALPGCCHECERLPEASNEQLLPSSLRHRNNSSAQWRAHLEGSYPSSYASNAVPPKRVRSHDRGQHDAPHGRHLQRYPSRSDVSSGRYHTTGHLDDVLSCCAFPTRHGDHRPRGLCPSQGRNPNLECDSADDSDGSDWRDDTTRKDSSPPQSGMATAVGSPNQSPKLELVRFDLHEANEHSLEEIRIVDEDEILPADSTPRDQKRLG